MSAGFGATELEGLIPTYGDLIAITHDMAHWGSGGEIIAQDGLKLTLSEPVEFTSGTKNVLALRQKDGSLSGPYEVTATELNTEVMLKTQPDAEIVLASDGYPKLKPTLKESEEELAKIIETDPLCYKTYFSTKGLKKGNFSFDDRTYIRFKS